MKSYICLISMSRRATIVFALLFAGSLVIRDVALGLIFSPITTFVFAEMHNEKESSEKGAKEGAKESDEFRLPSIHAHSVCNACVKSAFHIPDPPFYASVISEVQGRPPEVA